MSRASIVFILGILLLIVPQLGLPQMWKMYFIIVCGILLVIVGYSLRRSAYMRSIENEDGERQTESFVENGHNQQQAS